MSATAIIQADTLGQFLANAQALTQEAKLRVEPGGFELAATDPANVGMIDQSLSSDAFESYGFDGGVLGVDLSKIDDVVSMAGADDLVHLELDNGTRKLHIEIDGLQYTMALIDSDSIRSEPTVLDIEADLTATLVCEARRLQRVRKAADMVSDHIAFGADADDGMFHAESQGDTDDVRMEWARDDIEDGSQIGDDAETLLSLDYVADLLKPLAAGTEVTLRFGTELPVFLESAFADGHSELQYLLAPRLETN